MLWRGRHDLLGWRAGQASSTEGAKSRSASARGSAVVVAGIPGTTSVVIAPLCWDSLAKGAAGVLEVYPMLVVERLVRLVQAHGHRIQIEAAVLLGCSAVS